MLEKIQISRILYRDDLLNLWIVPVILKEVKYGKSIVKKDRDY